MGLSVNAQRMRVLSVDSNDVEKGISEQCGNSERVVNAFEHLRDRQQKTHYTIQDTYECKCRSVDTSSAPMRPCVRKARYVAAGGTRPLDGALSALKAISAYSEHDMRVGGWSPSLVLDFTLRSG